MYLELIKLFGSPGYCLFNSFLLSLEKIMKAFNGRGIFFSCPSTYCTAIIPVTQQLLTTVMLYKYFINISISTVSNTQVEVRFVYGYPASAFYHDTF